MNRTFRQIVVGGFAYAAIGVVTGGLAGSAASIPARDAWRLAGWILSFVVFVGHLAHERIRVGSAPVTAARRAAAAVALGAFLLAAAGPVRSYWGTERFWRITALSLVLWPIVTGIPAFVVGFVVATTHRRVVSVRERP